MKHEWHVVVRDPDGGAIEDAEVTLQAESVVEALGSEYPYAEVPATHRHDGAGHYLAVDLEMSAGAWLLIARRKQSSPVVQALLMQASAEGEFYAKPPPTRLAQCVTFTAETTEAKGERVRKTTFTITLFPQSEVVFLSGTEYDSRGTSFLLFALGRRDALFREKKIDAGTLVTILSCDNRGLGTFVKAHRGFIDVRPLPPPPEGVRPGRAHVPLSDDTEKMGRALAAAGALSIVDLYRYLSEVGELRPGSVKEVSIFSHAWEGGPILYDTNDIDVERPRPNARSPFDFDGRPKDFAAENVEAEDGWPHMKEALAEDGVFRAFGCNAVSEYRLAIATAEANKNRGETAIFTYNLFMPPFGRLERGLNRKFLHRFLFQRFADPERTYLAAAAKFFDKAVIGAPPGAGSEFAVRHGIPLMRVVAKSWGKLYPYYKEHFGPEFEPSASDFDEGYVDVHKIAGRDPPADPGFNSSFFRFSINFQDDRTKLEFFDLFATVEASRRMALTHDALNSGGRTGQRYVLHHTDSAQEQGFFVTDDREVFALERGADGKFSVVGEKLAPPE